MPRFKTLYDNIQCNVSISHELCSSLKVSFLETSLVISIYSAVLLQDPSHINCDSPNDHGNPVKVSTDHPHLLKWHEVEICLHVCEWILKRATEILTPCHCFSIWIHFWRVTKRERSNALHCFLIIYRAHLQLFNWEDYLRPLNALVEVRSRPLNGNSIHISLQGRLMSRSITKRRI